MPSAALLASTGLLLFLSRLTLRQLRSKERETEQLEVRQAELERLVERRTEELSELSTHLQAVAEQEKAALSRELHDELGGLLVAARMDLSWLEERIASHDPEVRRYFERVHECNLLLVSGNAVEIRDDRGTVDADVLDPHLHLEHLNRPARRRRHRLDDVVIRHEVPPGNRMAAVQPSTHPQARYQPGIAQALADLVIDVLKGYRGGLQVWRKDAMSV